MKSLLVSNLFIFLFIFSAAGQVSLPNRFTDHSNEDGVNIQYRWVNSTKDKNSPLELRLKIKNNNSYPVIVSYEIEFFMGPVMEENSGLTELCINPKLAKTGKLNGMYYQSVKLKNKQLQSEEFSWEISDLKIEKVEKCR